ncbi:techylectin-5B-like [Anopheles marshallii]|uniref:techylectin-5B-like n=1 Tax=Anopheles marshallii TaxID=1521116 RepID=UPI00237AD991|nr:techylectin-5B-like [Anopheles marshallii]
MKWIVLVFVVGCMLSFVSANSNNFTPKVVKPIARFNNPTQDGSDNNLCGCLEIVARIKKVEENLLKLIQKLRNKHSSLYSELLDMKKHMRSVSWYVGQTSEASHRFNEQLLGDSISLAQIMHAIRDLTINQQNSVTKTFLTESFLALEKRHGDSKGPTSVVDIVYASCDDSRITQTGTYLVQDAFGEPTKVICVLEFLPGAYTVIQNRHEGSTDFYRGYSDYRSGFGEFDGGDYWLGLDRINNITASGDYELMILLEDFEKNVTYAHYDNFAVGSGNDFYPITKLDGYSGTAGDSLRSLVGVLFSAYDLDVDYSEGNCAVSNRGAWWYTDCGESNLNGFYLKGLSSSTTGMFWETFRGANYSLKSSRMMIKRKEMVSTTDASTAMSTESTSMTTGETTSITSMGGKPLETTSATVTESSSTDASPTISSESTASTTTSGEATSTTAVAESASTTSGNAASSAMASESQMLDITGSSGVSVGNVATDMVNCNYNCTIYLRGEFIKVSELPPELINLDCNVPKPGIPCCTKHCLPKN